MSNQYFASVTLDPARGRHSGGDMVIPVPYWGFLDLSGHFIERAQNNNSIKNLYLNVFNFSAKFKRYIQILLIVEMKLENTFPQNALISVNQPLLPVALLPRKNVPMACKPPLCNPYHANLGVGVERNVFIEDGAEGELDLPIPIGKDIAYRLPISGNIHFGKKNIFYFF
uniref:Uncharacterized protein n=1 Tax=Heterorhabditis bacteriophora TaxID=37862 RepID=A0A1I7WDY6_HETBA